MTIRVQKAFTVGDCISAVLEIIGGDYADIECISGPVDLRWSPAIDKHPWVRPSLAAFLNFIRESESLDVGDLKGPPVRNIYLQVSSLISPERTNFVFGLIIQNGVFRVTTIHQDGVLGQPHDAHVIYQANEETDMDKNSDMSRVFNTLGIPGPCDIRNVHSSEEWSIDHLVSVILQRDTRFLDRTLLQTLDEHVQTQSIDRVKYLTDKICSLPFGSVNRLVSYYSGVESDSVSTWEWVMRTLLLDVGQGESAEE